VKLSRVIVSLALVVCLARAVSAKEIRIPRHPDYHDGKIAFSYLGDIWVVNEDGSNPRRLTVNTARDVYPRWSPDGKWIAFSSNRYGNYDVFIVPAEGGEAKQLTFHSANDTVVGWSRDSRHVIFSSARGVVYPGVANLYRVAVAGGLEEMLPADWGYWGSYSPDGKKLVFNRHAPTWWRKHYRGSNAADLWIYDAEKKSYRKILDTEGNDREKANNSWPQYGNNGEIFFVSDRDVTALAGSPEVLKSTNQLYKISENGGKPTQLTHFRDGSLFYPSISSDGKVIVFEEDLGLWKLDTASGKTTEVKVNIASDEKENNFEVLTITGDADSYDLSPSSHRAAISAHGEIFTIATERGDVGRVTSSYARDVDPRWSPDGKWIAWVSDQSGRDEVWVADEEGKNAKKLSDGDTEKLSLHWFPDSKSLGYTSSDHKLWVVDVTNGQSRSIASNEAGNVNGVSISPDGKWVAYAAPDRDLRAPVFVVAAAGGQAHQLSDDRLFSSFAPRFTPDGRKLIILGGYVQGGSATLRQNAAALYSVSLASEDRDPMSRDIDNEEAGRAADAATAGRGGRGGAAASMPDVKIDFDGMAHRIRQITRLTENISTAVPSPDSRTYAFVAPSDVSGRSVSTLYTISENGDQLRQVTRAQPPAATDEEAPPPGGGMGGGGIRDLQFSRDGRSVYFMEGTRIYAATVGAPAGTGAQGGGAGTATAGGGGAAGAGGEGAAARRVNFTVRVEVDLREEHRQIFNEAWRVLKHRFYDAKMNGVDWSHMRQVYEPLLADVADREELQNVTLQMIGELNASHTGMSGGGEPNRNAMQTRNPGFEIAPDASGFYKVTWIYKDGPADKDFVKVHVGDFILAVNGTPLKSGDNYYRLYNLLPGRKFEFTVNSKPSMDGAWTTKVEPANNMAYGTLQYQKWVDDRRQMVEKLSNGEIGYLHIRQMNEAALHQFERDLADNRFKKAIIIDQRFNPGGGIDQELLEILEQHQYQYTRNRDSVFVTRPQRAFFGPIVVMENERSFSDAEVFPDGIHALKLAKVVGISSNGSVIGTGAFRLIDGSMVRTPGTGLWDVSGQNLENYGVPADVWVDNTPDDFFKGRDAQLEKAVEVLKEELRKNPPQNIPGR
jgi:tricorn protease